MPIFRGVGEGGGGGVLWVRTSEGRYTKLRNLAEGSLSAACSVPGRAKRQYRNSLHLNRGFVIIPCMAHMLQSGPQNILIFNIHNHSSSKKQDKNSSLHINELFKSGPEPKLILLFPFLLPS